MPNHVNRASLPRLYQTAFTRDHSAKFGERQMRFSVVRAGTLHLPTGRIVACDPLVKQRRDPFLQTVLPGRYAVDISLGHDKADNVESILFSRILFTKDEPVIWVKALREGEVVNDDDEGFGFPSTSRTVAYMDQETAGRFRLDTMTELDHFLDSLVNNFRPTRSWLNHMIEEDHNAICFSVNRTRGVVSTYFAIDGSGDICLALTSLFL